ncbi:MAG: type II toxin-antitoxin system prevent-host-death family antitoxin [Pseudonocardia sp.]|nr:type II toxin-antitoxin system prevent-host-death family antitoxin [Pseudonocardia sp.]
MSRNLAAVLDQAEQGETIAVTRSGRRVALIVPAPARTGLRCSVSGAGGSGSTTSSRRPSRQAVPESGGSRIRGATDPRHGRARVRRPRSVRDPQAPRRRAQQTSMRARWPTDRARRPSLVSRGHSSASASATYAAS